MKFKDIQTEEKVRLDPKCWTGKKIGNPKTKMKGGVRVNNCVPAESVEEAANPAQQAAIAIAKKKEAGKQGVAEMDKSQTPPGRDGHVSHGTYGSRDKKDPDAGKKQYTAKGITANQATTAATDILSKAFKDSQRVDPRTGKKMVQKGVAEDFDGEYDDEAGMAQGNLYTIAQAAQGLLDTIDDKDNLPEWCQEKIAKVEGMLVSVWNYLQSQKAQGIDPEIDEMYEAMDELAEDMAAKKGVSADLVWEAFEAMDDHMLYETAAWRRKEGKSKTGGLNAKGVASYRRENPGSKLQTAVTTKPSKLKKGSKAAKRRKSFCARMSGVKGPMKKPNGKPTRKALALRKWNC